MSETQPIDPRYANPSPPRRPKLSSRRSGRNWFLRTVGLIVALFVLTLIAVPFYAWSRIDKIGGIKMCLPKAMSDDKAHINLPAGCQQLDGVNALGYVRSRHADNKNDFGRVERQRQMVGAIAKKASSPSTFLNPVRYYNV